MILIDCLEKLIVNANNFFLTIGNLRGIIKVQSKTHNILGGR